METSPASSSPPVPPPREVPDRIGIIAAGGRFPVQVAASAHRRGIQVFAVGHPSVTSMDILEHCAAFRRLGLGRLSAAIRFFRRNGVEELTFAGWVRKETLFRPWRLLSILPDWRLIRLWYFRVRNRQDHTLLAAVADEFEKEGIHVAHSTKYCPELLAPEGPLTRKQPTKAQLQDIAFGWKVARRMADLDVGQSVVVCEQATIAVEGIEGTDRNIRRAGELCKRGGFTVVKLAKEGHDMRFDVPTIGPETIESMRAAGGAVLAIEAGRTMMIEREALIEKADRLGIAVISLRDAPSPP